MCLLIISTSKMLEKADVSMPVVVKSSCCGGNLEETPSFNQSNQPQVVQHFNLHKSESQILLLNQSIENLTTKIDMLIDILQRNTE